MRISRYFPSGLVAVAKSYVTVVVLWTIWGVALQRMEWLEAVRSSAIPDPLAALRNLFYLQVYVPAMLRNDVVVHYIGDLVFGWTQLYLVLAALVIVVGKLLPRRRAPLATWSGMDLDGHGLRRPWWFLPIRMAFATFLTISLAIGFIGGLVLRMYPGDVLLWARGWPLYLSLAVAAMGLFWGLRFSRSARSVVTGHFGATFLPEDSELSQRVHALSDRLNLPRPAVAYVNQVNAFAVGSSPKDAAVVLGVPLLKHMTREELDAVIAHELGHIVSQDMRQMQVAVGYQKMFGQVFSLVGKAATQFSAGMSNSSSGKAQSEMVGDTVRELGSRIIFLGGELLCKGKSRQREYYADAIGAGLTSPEAMAGALDRLSTIKAEPTPPENRYAYLMFRPGKGGFRPFDTHPSMEKRKAALLKGTYLAQLPRRPS